MFGPGRPYISVNVVSRNVIKGHGKTQGGHLEILHTTLKYCEDFEFSICQDSQKILLLETCDNEWNKGE